MANFPESGHIGAEYGEPSIMFHDLSPDVDPIRSRPGHTVDGISVDDLLEEKRYSDHQEWLLMEAKRSLVTQFSRQVFAGMGYGTGYASGFAGGGILGAITGFLAMSVATSAVEQMTGTPVTDAINAVSPEIARLTSDAGNYVAGGISFLTDHLPPELADKTYQYIANFQNQVMGTIAGVKVATFTGNKVGGMWYGPGDRLGETVGTKVSAPLVRLHSRFPINISSIASLNPFRRSQSIG